tara:strand:+ start:120 stop:656 length:537 start_codon:yes stop_codon:yes gene_type:complete
MNLVYHIPNKLYYIQNFLDYPTYKKIHYDIFKDKNTKLYSTKNMWDDCLKHGHKQFVESAKLNIDYKPLQKIKILLENNPFHKIKIKNFRSHVNSIKEGAGINWHDDYSYHYGITYYVNYRWNKKFGGEFLFMDENIKGFIPLVGNSLVVVKAPLYHKVTPVMSSIVPRKTIQIFVDK